MLTVYGSLTGCSLASKPTSEPAISAFPLPTQWQALSRTAMSITGDLVLSDTRLIFGNQAVLNLMLIEHNAETGQTLFRVKGESNPVLLNGNRLCGQQPVNYLMIQLNHDQASYSDMQMTAYYDPKALRLSALSLTDHQSLNKTMCALFTYSAHEHKN